MALNSCRSFKALVWGESMKWETVVYDVTPISYAQCGLYRQFHRREEHIYSNILNTFTANVTETHHNVPNKYLAVGHQLVAERPLGKNMRSSRTSYCACSA